MSATMRSHAADAAPLSRLILVATAVCGTLDNGYAIGMSLLRGGSALNVLTGVASGPFGDDIGRLGWSGAALGLLTHFTIMTVMVAVFCVAVRRMPRLNANPWLSGFVYGVLTYVVMYWIVLALRWPSIFPQTDAVKIVRALVPHVICVGIPLAWLARKAAAPTTMDATIEP